MGRSSGQAREGCICDAGEPGADPISRQDAAGSLLWLPRSLGFLMPRFYSLNPVFALDPALCRKPPHVTAPRTLFSSLPTAHSNGSKLVVTQQRLTPYRQAKASPSTLPHLPTSAQSWPGKQGGARGYFSEEMYTSLRLRGIPQGPGTRTLLGCWRLGSHS